MAARNPDAEFHIAEQIAHAIKNNLLIKLRYEYDRMERTFAPYAMYESILGNIIIYGFQVHNPAKPLDNEHFRYYALRRLSFVRLTDTEFQPGSGYSPSLLKGCRQLIITLDSTDSAVEEGRPAQEIS